MKKVVLNIDEAGNLVDMTNKIIYSGFSTANYKADDIKQGKQVDIVELVSLGVTSDELLKLKVAGLLQSS